MKNCVIIILFLFCFNGYSQQVQGTAVKVSNVSVNERELNLKPEKKDILTPLVVDLSQYTNITIGVTGYYAWSWEKDIEDALENSRFIVDKKKFKKGVTKMNPNTLYFFWNRSADIDDRTTSIILRDYKMNILFSANYVNVGTAEILSFLLNQ